MPEIHGFELLQEQSVPEIQSLVKRFRHVKSGAELLSVENDDENKVFGITFRTPPPDSTGLPHIMEHSVLCGSRKYPVKEPFVELLKGSLNTFLNAFTYPDKTCYPVASQNVKDLYNMVDVYLDAVLYPRIEPHILEQEGWHYELERPEDPLTVKGVVFNEMKGAYSSPDNLLSRHSQQYLFPDTTYGLDSGGDPFVIPHLTYQQFKNFHDTYYHPSNARLFFYGDDEPQERLRFLNEWLKDFDIREVNSGIAIQQAFATPKTFTIPYDAAEEDEGRKKGMMTINWLLPESSDPKMVLSFHLLDYILVGTPASPLRKALIDSGLGEDITGVGLESELRQMYFSTGLKGMDVADADQVESLIDMTLKTLAHDSIAPDMVEAAVNSTEFWLRERNTGNVPRGLALMLDSLTNWVYGADPISPLAFEAPLQAIKDQIKAEKFYFERLITTYLLNNTHRTRVLLTPDATLGKRLQAEEEERLAQIKAAMSPKEVEAIIARTADLKRRQETPDSPEALATLPMLTLADLEKTEKVIPLDIMKAGNTELLHHDLFTNGIVYLDLGFNLHALPPELVPYAPLFGRALVKIGTETEDFVRLSQRIGRKTGGIWPSFFNSALPRSADSAAWLFLRGKSTMAQVDDLLTILKDVLLTVRLDNQERFTQMVLESKARKESSLIPAGSQVANTRLRARFHESGWFSEQTSGVSSLFFIRRLSEEIEHNWPAVLEKLEAVRQIVINRQAMVCNVTLDSANWLTVQPKLVALLDTLPQHPTALAAWSPQNLPGAEGLIIPAQVNYVAKGVNLYNLGYTYHGSVAVINNYLRTTWLWERVRVQGGAYGAFCSFDRRSGVFGFASYRDPNITHTLEIYDQTGQFLRELELSEEELTKSIIGVIGRIDDYQLPDAKGYTSMVRHLIGESREQRQKIRDEVLGTTVNDFQAFGDVLNQVGEHGSVVVLGAEEAIQQANTKHEEWLNTLKVL